MPTKTSKLSNWIRNPNKTKYVTDITLLLFFVFASIPLATGVAIHEWISFIYVVPFLVHLLIHWDWILNIPKRLFGRLELRIRINVIWDALLYLTMVFVILSGILISAEALPFLGIQIEPDNFWLLLHFASSNLLFLMIGIHLALHWNWIVKTTKHMFSSKNEGASNEPIN